MRCSIFLTSWLYVGPNFQSFVSRQGLGTAKHSRIEKRQLHQSYRNKELGLKGGGCPPFVCLEALFGVFRKYFLVLFAKIDVSIRCFRPTGSPHSTSLHSVGHSGSCSKVLRQHKALTALPPNEGYSRCSLTVGKCRD